MLNNWMNYVKRVREEEDGITALETAIILIAFVVVASVFAFTMLSAGTFSTERGKEAIYAGLGEVQSSMDVKGSVIATAQTVSSPGVSGTVDALIFTVSNALGGEPVNLGDQSEVVFEYRDASQRVVFDPADWEVEWLGNANDNGLLETGELAEIKLTLTGNLINTLGPNTTFVLEIKPPRGAVLNLQRTTPAWLELVNDLN